MLTLFKLKIAKIATSLDQDDFLISCYCTVNRDTDNKQKWSRFLDEDCLHFGHLHGDSVDSVKVAFLQDSLHLTSR